jgi:putative N6-adenine-specific DNA methylase
MGFDGTQAVVDPMCGSGTIPIEAAEIAAGLLPGRSREFAFAQMVGSGSEGPFPSRPPGYLENDDMGARFFGFDRDDGAIRGARGNAERAQVANLCRFERQAVSDLVPPEGLAPGIVLTNPPYGGRIGDRKLLFALYGALGRVLAERFIGWRVGIVTSDRGLAQATGLGLEPMGPVDHSGTKVWLWHGTVG